MLDSSPLSQCLDRRSKLFGYELFDLFVVFFTMALLNFIFSSFPHRTLFVWGPTIGLAIAIRVAKVGKPENYLKHLAFFHLMPKMLSAFSLCQDHPPKLPKKSIWSKQ